MTLTEYESCPEDVSLGSPAAFLAVSLLRVVCGMAKMPRTCVVLENIVFILCRLVCEYVCSQRSACVFFAVIVFWESGIVGRLLCVAGNH